MPPGGSTDTGAGSIDTAGELGGSGTPGPPGGVDSVNGQVGAVTIVSGDELIQITEPIAGEILVQQAVAADWPLATTRTFLLDEVNGVDANPGFSDVAGPYNPATQAKKTPAALSGIIPRLMRARKFRVLVASGAASAALDTYLGGLVGHGSACLVRGTTTNATAGSVAFADSAAERICAGFVTATGMNAPGYHPVAAFSATTIKCLQAGGGAPAFPAEPGRPLMVRIRFDSATTTAALRNIARTVIQRTATDTIVVDSAFPAVPVGTDTFYLEEGGVVVGAYSLAAGSVQPATNLQIVGVRSTGTGTLNDGRYTLVGCDAASLSFNGCNSISTVNNGSYTDPLTGGAIVCGGGTRSEGTTLFQGTLSPGAVSNLLSIGLLSTLNCPQAPNFGAGVVAGAGISLQSFSSTNLAIVGSTSALRILAPGVTAGALLLGMSGRIENLNVTGSGAKPAVTLRAAGFIIVTAGLTGATGNNDVGLDLTTATDAHVIMLSQPTITGALGDVRLANGTIVTWASLFAFPQTDTKGNTFSSPNGNGQAAPLANGVVVVALGAFGPAGSSATPTRWVKMPDGSGGFFTVPSFS